MILKMGEGEAVRGRTRIRMQNGEQLASEQITGFLKGREEVTRLVRMFKATGAWRCGLSAGGHGAGHAEITIPTPFQRSILPAMPGMEARDPSPLLNGIDRSRGG